MTWASGLFTVAFTVPYLKPQIWGMMGNTATREAAEGVTLSSVQHYRQKGWASTLPHVPALRLNSCSQAATAFSWIRKLGVAALTLEGLLMVTRLK